MTSYTIQHTPARAALNRLVAAFQQIGHAMTGADAALRCGREAERLLHLPEAELARMGLTRDTVVQHAFRGYLVD